MTELTVRKLLIDLAPAFECEGLLLIHQRRV